MSFNYHARRVRDPDRPPWRRLTSLRACVASYCWLTRARYRPMLASLGLEVPYQPQRQPPPAQELLRTLDQLERARNVYLDRLRAFERKRIRAKAHGNRHLSTAERALLDELESGIG